MKKNIKLKPAVWVSLSLAVLSLVFISVTQLSKVSGGNSFLEKAIAATETTSSTKIDGKCGTKQGVYNIKTWLSSTECAPGDPVPSFVELPTPGSFSSWKCVGKNGGKTSYCNVVNKTPSADTKPKCRGWSPFGLGLQCHIEL